jgi:7,8-dihydropterin-6-yl-methyl-4-(beta-D-ribofuranosyl)aminobenzene 5'-phosphate synthase
MRLYRLVVLACVLAVAPSQAGASPKPSPNRVTILYDAFGHHQGLIRDWGFAALVEHDGKRILFDTGNNADICVGSTSWWFLTATATTPPGSTICFGSIRG